MGEAQILVVEDEVIVARNIQSQLEKLGYAVPHTASSGEEAIQKALSARPDLILMDIKLEGDMDGIEAARHIRAEFDVPIIYLTAYSDEQILDRAKATKPYSYLMKPFKIQELNSNIKTALYHHQIEMSVKLREHRLWSILQSMGNAVITTDCDGHVTFTNALAEQMLGLTFETAKDHPIEDIMRVSKESFDWLDEDNGEILKLRRADNQTTYILRSTSPLYYDDSYSGNVVLFRDVSRAKEMSEQLRTAHDLLEQRVEERTRDLKQTNNRLVEEMANRKRAEEDVVHTHENLQNVIDSASELIFSFDEAQRISSWNQTAEEILGYPSREIMGRYLSKIDYMGAEDQIKTLISEVHKNKKPVFDRLAITTKTGETKILNVTCSCIHGSRDNSLRGTLLIGKDITNDWNSHRYVLWGNSYLITDRKESMALNLFINLTRSTSKGLFVTRDSPTSIRSKTPKTNVEVISLGTNEIDGFTSVSSLEGLEHSIKGFYEDNPGGVVLLDGIHYLVAKLSFDRLLEWLFEMTEFVSVNDLLLLVRVDDRILDQHQLGMLENELKMLPSQQIEDIHIDDELASMLMFISEQNQKNALVPIKKLMSRFDIVYLTAAKRIKMLEEEGLVFTRRQGKTKTAHISDKGENLLNNRKTA